MHMLRSLLLVLLMTGPVVAQQQEQLVGPQILIVDSDRLYFETQYGLRLARDLAAQQAEVQLENDKIVETLTEEERSLTLRRPDMTPEAFRAEADAFDLMSEASQVEFLYNTLMTLHSAGENLDHMVAEWADGDVEGLGLLVADAEATGAAKELYERVLVTRNKNWIPVIEGYLDEPGTFFIAAGSAHFAGPDSVILMLEEKGYTVERIN